MATHEALLVISKLLCPPSERISIKQLLDNPWFDLILSAKDFIGKFLYYYKPTQIYNLLNI